MERYFTSLILAGLALLGVWGAWSRLRRGRRQDQLRQWAGAHNLQFRPRHYRYIGADYPHFTCFHNGDNRYAFNLACGRWGRHDVRAFDYHYETVAATDEAQRAQRVRDHYFSAVIVDSPVPLLSLEIRPEGLLDKLADFVGSGDINFESAQFSRRFHVSAPDRKWAYDVLHPRAIQLLLEAPDFHVQMCGSGVIAYVPGRRFEPDTFERALDLLTGLLDLLPEYVRRPWQPQPPRSQP